MQQELRYCQAKPECKARLLLCLIAIVLSQNHESTYKSDITLRELIFLFSRATRSRAVFCTCGLLGSIAAANCIAPHKGFTISLSSISALRMPSRAFSWLPRFKWHMPLLYKAWPQWALPVRSGMASAYYSSCALHLARRCSTV